MRRQLYTRKLSDFQLRVAGPFSPPSTPQGPLEQSMKATVYSKNSKVRTPHRLLSDIYKLVYSQHIKTIQASAFYFFLSKYLECSSCHMHFLLPRKTPFSSQSLLTSYVSPEPSVCSQPGSCFMGLFCFSSYHWFFWRQRLWLLFPSNRASTVEAWWSPRATPPAGRWYLVHSGGSPSICRKEISGKLHYGFSRDLKNFLLILDSN